MKVNFLEKPLKEKYKVNVRFIILECNVCHSSWGISFPEIRELTDYSFTCRNCSNKK